MLVCLMLIIKANHQMLWQYQSALKQGISDRTVELTVCTGYDIQ